MHERFLEIAFEAELDTRENPELKDIAPELCSEYPDTREAAITELRAMIYDRRECFPLRTDDAYLLRFLRARHFIVPRAHKLLVRYCNFREQYPHLYQDVDLWSLAKVKAAYEGSMYDRPDVGRLSIFRFGTWDPNEFPVDDLVRAGMAMLEIALRQPKIQVIGGTAIIDLEGVTLRHVATLTPTIAYQIVSLMGTAMPARLRSCHIINYSWILNTFFYLFKRFIPRESYDRIFFHGYDVKSLQRHIPQDCLPSRYGGTCKSHCSIGDWMLKIKKYRDENFDKDMKEIGYLIKEYRRECFPLRTDDAYLLRFLRARHFIVPRAHKLLVRYCNFREQYPHLYQDVDLWSLAKVKAAYEGSMYDRPDVGRLSIFRFGTWDPNEFPVDDLVRAGMAMLEIALRQPKIQVIGGTAIIDLEGVTLRHVATLTPTIAYQIVSLMGTAMPARLRSCHIINYSWILNTFFYLFKRFIPRESYDRIFFHGYDVKSLQRHIPQDCLPSRYGGTCKSHCSIGDWMLKIKKYRDENFDKDMKEIGYLIKE